MAPMPRDMAALVGCSQGAGSMGEGDNTGSGKGDMVESHSFHADVAPTWKVLLLKEEERWKRGEEREREREGK